jgi:DNA ligase-1
MRRWIWVFFLCLVGAMPVAAAPALMLASNWRDGPDVSRYWVSEKLDGVRARWDGKQLWSRSGQRIATPNGFTAQWPDLEMDGELWLGRGRFDQTNALLRQHPFDEAQWRQLCFMVFDLPGHAGTFNERVAAMRRLQNNRDHPSLQIVAQQQLVDGAALQAQLKQVVDSGGEGLMLQHGDNRYMPGRSLQLFKLKPWDDAEARVIGHLPGKGKYVGMLGSLLVEADDGRRFRLGSGLKDAERRDPPPLGSVVTYRYNGLTSNGLPRFARYLRLRDPGATVQAR